MKHIIDHFMWGYQPHFRINCKFVAERLFLTLDKRFRPTIFLVGILENPEMPNRFPACVEPEDDFWIQSDEFDRVFGNEGLSASTLAFIAIFSGRHWLNNLMS
jgi:hypothetical protein